MLQRAIPPLNQRDGKSNGDLFYNFASGYRLLGDNSEAVKFYELALDEFRLESNAQMESEISLKAAELYSSLKSPLQEARCYGVASLSFASQLDFQRQAVCMCKQATILAEQSAFHEAVAIAEDCLCLCERHATSIQPSKSRHFFQQRFYHLDIVHFCLQRKFTTNLDLSFLNVAISVELPKA